jgi:hypothetical protein
LATTLASALMFGIGGCGKVKKTNVSGKVTYRGKPLPSGTIIFESTDPKGGSGSATIANGEYATDNAPLGDVKVYIQLPPPLPAGVGTPKDGKATPPPPGAGSPKPVPKDWITTINLRYGSPRLSPLKANLKDGKNPNTNFELK